MASGSDLVVVRIELGYRVPTDDPNDSESPSELVEDAKDKVVMEQSVLVSVEDMVSQR